MEDFLGRSLKAEVFELSGSSLNPRQAAPAATGQPVQHASHEAWASRAVLDASPVDAAASFEVFMGRVYDPAEGEYAKADGRGMLSAAVCKAGICHGTACRPACKLRVAVRRYRGGTLTLTHASLSPHYYMPSQCLSFAYVSTYCS